MIRMDMGSPAVSPNSVQPLDAIDTQIVALLTADGRMTNAELAGRLGVAPSTAHARLRALVERGVITGFHASVDERMLGPACRRSSA